MIALESLVSALEQLEGYSFALEEVLGEDDQRVLTSEASLAVALLDQNHRPDPVVTRLPLCAYALPLAYFPSNA